MGVTSVKTANPSLVWVLDEALSRSLDKATWLETARELSDLAWHVTIAAVDAPSDGVDPRVSIVRLPRPRAYLVGPLVFHAALLFRLLHQAREADLILFHQPSLLFLMPLVALRRLARGRGPRLVMDARTVPMSVETPREQVRSLYFTLCHRLANRSLDGQTAITRRLASGAGIDARRLLGVWPSGVRAEQFRPALALRRARKGPAELRLIYIGSLHNERNLLGLCQAVALVRAEGLAVGLTLVGDGKQRQELEAYARTAGAGFIAVLPPVPHERIPELLAAADIGVLPFPDLEKFRVSSPIKLFEYLAAGLPILATRISCHTDVLAEHGAYWAEGSSVAALADAIRAAYGEREGLGRRGEEAQALAAAWTWRASAEQLDRALRSVL